MKTHLGPAAWLFALGQALSEMEQMRWECSTGAQLNILLSVADMLGLTKAEQVLQPMVQAMIGEDGQTFVKDAAE